MKPVKNTRILSILERTLDYVDPRLIDHGKRVSYIMYLLLKDEPKYSRLELRNICILSLLHDIGAYRTEEIDRMVRFETEEIWEHSIFGYLFLREFSPLSDLAQIIMFHHADCASLDAVDASYHEVIQLLNIADRMDVLYQTRYIDDDSFRQYVESYRDITFGSSYLDYFFAKNIKYPASNYIDGDLDYNSLLNDTPFTAEEIDSYLWMIVVSIDFRSRHTVTHTLMTARISVIMAEFLGYPSDQIEKIRIAALLHDVGKSGIPIEILEAPGALTKEEMDVMRRHVEMTEHILTDNIDPMIKHIAIRHHEKLNGSGYPYHLTAPMLTREDAIVAVADILSALVGKRSYKDPWPKDKTVSVLRQMTDAGELNPDIVDLVIRHYDEIINQVVDESYVIFEKYERIMQEYDSVLGLVNEMRGIAK